MAKVELIACTPDAERLVAASAKICYSPAEAAKILEDLTPEKTEKFLKLLADLGHESPIEHATFTFAIEGVSRSLLAQITRHRIASFSVQSQRYVKENSFHFVTPPEIAALPEAAERYQQAMSDSYNHYLELAAILEKKHMEQLLAEGVAEKAAKSRAEKAAIEYARYVLPNACETKMMLTMNARSLRNFFRLRCCNRAQWEIRELAWQMLALCREKCPVLFAYAGPACVHGPCVEGKMTCGQMLQVRERSEKLNG